MTGCLPEDEKADAYGASFASVVEAVVAAALVLVLVADNT